jgi:hypothetical protein
MYFVFVACFRVLSERWGYMNQGGYKWEKGLKIGIIKVLEVWKGFGEF